MANLDQILNFAIPAILILVVVGFLWTKVLGQFLGPLFVRLWEWMKGNGEKTTQHTGKREIVYD